MIAILLAALAGIVARTLLPFLQVLKDKPETKFDRAYLLPAIVSVIVALITAPLVLAALPPETWQAVTPQSLIGVFVAAWGLTDIVRQGQKLF